MKYCSILLLILLSGCGLFEQTKSGDVLFEGGLLSRSQRSVINYTDYDVDESMNSLEEEYGAYGTKIGSYTPQNFTIALRKFHFVKKHEENMTILERSNSMYMAVSLAGNMTYDKRNRPELFAANFIDDVALYPDEDFQVQTYDGIIIAFMSPRVSYSESISQGKSYISKMESMITVHIPGYENVWPDWSLQSRAELIEQFESRGIVFSDPDPYAIIDETRNFINNPDGSISFGMEHLRGGVDSLFFDMYSDAIHLVDNPLYENEIIAIPFDGLHVKKDTSALSIVVSWDLENIIELYDNNTPDLLTDDILVLAPDFWKRLSIEITEH